MKKIFSILFALGCVIGIKAQTEMSLVPVEGNVADGFDMYLELNNPETANQVIVMEIDIKWPDGWKVTPYIERDYLGNDRYYYKSGKAWVTDWSIKGAKQEGGYYKYMVSGGNINKLKDSSGNIINFWVEVPSNTAPGIYTVELMSSSFIAVSTGAGSEIYMDKSQSFVYIGEAGDVTFAPEGVMTSIVTNNLPANVNVNLTDVTALRGNATNEVKSTYTREVANEWNTICLPFEAKSTEAVKFYTIDKVGEDFVEVIPVQNLSACTPALVKVTGNSLSVEGTGVNTSALSPGTMVGTFEPIKVTDPGSYYIKDNALYYINEYFNVGAFKAYYQNVASAKGNVLDIIEEATDINAVSADLNGIEEIYGVNGTRQQNLQNGLNIVKIGDKVMKVLVK